MVWKIVLIMMIASVNFVFGQDTASNQIDPAKKADIIALEKVIGNYDLAKDIINYTMNHFKTLASNVDSTYWKNFDNKFDPMELLEMNVPVFDRYFTHAEIKELLKFFSSPLGIKWNYSLPGMANELEVSNSRFEGSIREKLIDKLKKDNLIDYEK